MALNLLFWIVPLVIGALMRLLSPVQGRRWSEQLIQVCYRGAVGANSWWLRHVCGIHMQGHGDFNLLGQEVIVLANHRSWFDIPLLQAMVVPRGPILKFLVKRELAWVPIVGWVCLVLDFPLLKRKGSASARSQDLSAVSRAARERGSARNALIIFVEGTRFTEAKRDTLKSPYQHLLAPKAGGLRVVVQHSPPDVTLCDMTIVYGAEPVAFWRCLGGEMPRVDVYMKRVALADAGDIRTYLRQSWDQKELLLADSGARHADTPGNAS